MVKNQCYKLQKLFAYFKLLQLVVILFFHLNVSAQSFTLNGTIQGKDTGTVVLHYRNESNKTCSETASIINGKFQFNGTVAGADFTILDTDTNYTKADNKYATVFFIEPGIINISFNYGHIGNAKITGSKVQKENDIYNEYRNIDIKMIKEISSSVDSIRTLLKNNEINSDKAEEKLKELQIRSAPVRQSLREKDINYIRSNVNSFVSLKLLKFLVAQIPNDSIDVFYSRLSDEVKNSSLAYGFIEYYSNYKKAIGEEYPFDKLKVNEPAPAFTLYKEAGDSLTIDGFKGTVLLLDFWELTCLPCLKANPLIEELRKQYGENEIKIISISSTAAQELQTLKTYITKNNFLSWIHVSTSSDWKPFDTSVLNGEFQNYYGLGVPRSVVIDKTGKLAYKSWGYSPEEFKDLASAIDKAVKEK
jgi:thiol-disulfide isomerase/thioredoxin